MNALLDDVLAGDELAGGTRPELLHGQAAHQLLVRGRALGACAGHEAKEPADQRAHLRLEADDVEHQATHAVKPVNFVLPIFTTALKRAIVAIEPLSL